MSEVQQVAAALFGGLVLAAVGFGVAAWLRAQCPRCGGRDTEPDAKGDGRARCWDCGYVWTPDGRGT